MQNNLYDVKTIVNMYLDYFMNGFTISTFILSIYLLYSAVFIFHYSLFISPFVLASLLKK